MDCPNCGASIRDDGLATVVRCPFCSSHLDGSAAKRVPSRAELETEREQILAREREWTERLAQAGERRIEDYAAAPIGCCGLYFGLFVVGSLLLSAFGLKGSKEYGLLVAATAIIGGLVGFAVIVRRRMSARHARIAAIERERNAERGLREERLRRIEAELDALD